jgi:hypothetical protein
MGFPSSSALLRRLLCPPPRFSEPRISSRSCSPPHAPDTSGERRASSPLEQHGHPHRLTWPFLFCAASHRPFRTRPVTRMCAPDSVCLAVRLPAHG